MERTTKKEINSFLKMMTKNAYDNDGLLLDIKKQIENMKKHPSSFGYGVIDVSDSLFFGEIYTNKILFSHEDIKHINNKHYTDEDISRILSDVKNKIILANDYWDSRNKQQRKCFIIDDDDSLYLLSLRKELNNNIEINEITTLYSNGNYETFDINNYFYKVLFYTPKGNNKIKNKIYKNEKSNSNLSRFVFNQLDSVNKSIAKMIIAHKSNIISRDDIVEYPNMKKLIE